MLMLLFVLKLKPSVNLFALATVVCRKEEAVPLFGVAANRSDCSPTSSSLSPVLAVRITVEDDISNDLRFREKDTDSIEKQERA